MILDGGLARLEGSRSGKGLEKASLAGLCKLRCGGFHSVWLYAGHMKRCQHAFGYAEVVPSDSGDSQHREPFRE
jgi:hypothetical protein